MGLANFPNAYTVLRFCGCLFSITAPFCMLASTRRTASALKALMKRRGVQCTLTSTDSQPTAVHLVSHSACRFEKHLHDAAASSDTEQDVEMHFDHSTEARIAFSIHSRTQFF
jgi:hypothetical protein